MMAYVGGPSKRIFDTDNALKGTFDGKLGKWQLLTYSVFVLAYAIIVGWINRLTDFTMLVPKDVDCNPILGENQTVLNQTVIQRLSNPDKFLTNGVNNTAYRYNFSNEYGITVPSEFEILCDLTGYIRLPRFAHLIGYLIGALLLGFASDRGGRKMIVLCCIWVNGIMSVFQLVGHDFVSFAFFQFFIGLFVGGVQSSFLPAIIEMFPINFRTFYGVFFHLVVCLFEILLIWLARSFRSWRFLQIFVTVPIALTAILHWLVSESIFWYLAHKEYDKAIQVLTRLAKRNGLNFESKFKQAKEFLHAKHSKATQIDMLPLLRLQDIDILGQKYPQIDMAELHKQKSNSSKFRRFLNSLKGASYRSTNTIYRPFDFIYSPTLLVYVLILAGLWLTNGLTECMEIVKKPGDFDIYVNSTLANLSFVISSLLAIGLALIKMGRRWMIFLAYLVIEVCLLGSIIANFNYNQNDEQTEIGLAVLYHLCRFSAHFGLIFLMLITAELFPTSLRCTGMGICFALRAVGQAIASPHLFNHNETAHRLGYCLLTLFFGSLTLFLPETKMLPLPRSILQIEAMPGIIGKKLRSRKVKEACERRQLQIENSNQKNNNASHQENVNKLSSIISSTLAQANTTDQLVSSQDASKSGTRQQRPSVAASTSSQARDADSKGNQSSSINNSSNNRNYDTVTSVHDIEQDDHIYYGSETSKQQAQASREPLFSSVERKLGKILEVPSKNITRNNSMQDVSDVANTKV